MTLSQPLALLLLLALPLVIYLGFPRVAYRRRRDTLSLIIRCVILILLTLALAGLQRREASDTLAVVFLVDVSDSISPETRNAQIEYINEALAQAGPDDLAGVIVFGANAMPERPVSAIRALGAIQSAPLSTHTNLSAAIQQGLALFPREAARRMVVLSDGLITLGNTDAAVQRAAVEGVEISYVAFASERGPEVQVTDLRVPARITANQPFDLGITIDAQEAVNARVTILSGDSVIQQQMVDLRAGVNNYTLTLPGASAGFRDFRVQVDQTGDQDTFYQNNQLAAFSQVVGPPRVLLVSQDDAEISYLLPALEQIGVTIEQIAPEEMPISLAPLIQYDSVILANVPATRLTNRSMVALESYVRDLGGGLVAIGGPEAYGPGGYFQTPLESVLPVEMRIHDQERMPQLTLVYLIDQSGSMAMTGPSGVQNIELAKEAVIRSIDFLTPNDRAGIASFDSSAYWVAPMQTVHNREVMQNMAASLHASGGTDILAGLNLIAETIINEPSEYKHIILLTDGGVAPTGLIETSRALYEDHGVTTSVIAIGTHPVNFLEIMARVGNGNYHEAHSISNIPTIFAQETVLATRSYIMEQTFVPTVTRTNSIIDGITSAPPLLGYIGTTPKQTAQVILNGPEPFQDPILAAWQYGLGRSVAFTSDATGRWAQNWVTWGDFTRFWSQAISWTITEGTSNNLEMRVMMDNEQARLIVDARNDDGSFLNDLDLQAALVDPSMAADNITLRQTAPGRYEVTFTPSEEGAYFLGVNGSNATNSQSLTQTGGWVMSYSPEYDITANTLDRALLQDIATSTNGSDLSENLSGVFAHNISAQNAFLPLAPWLLLLAALLLPVDIAVRRLIITQSDWQRLKAALPQRNTAPTMPSAEERARVSSLMSAKQRGRQRTEDQAAESSISSLKAAQARRESATPQAEKPPLSRPNPQASTTPKPVVPLHKPEPEDGNIAGQLLKRRRPRNDD
jgi:uncharacterized membrane protein